MSLSHVNMWENEVGIVPVTLEEAIKRYPHSVSGESGIFHCGVCSERVTLAFGPKLHYFRHTDQAKDSSCPERAYNLEYGEYRSSLNTTRILPLHGSSSQAAAGGDGCFRHRRRWKEQRKYPLDYNK